MTCRRHRAFWGHEAGHDCPRCVGHPATVMDPEEWCLARTPRDGLYQGWPRVVCMLPRGHESDHMHTCSRCEAGVEWHWPITAEDVV